MTKKQEHEPGEFLTYLQVLIILHGRSKLVTLQLYYERIADTNQC